MNIKKSLRRYGVALLHPTRSMPGRLANRVTRNEIARRAEWSIRHNVSIKDFFAELNRRHVRYSVLRWFEDLPENPSCRDIDMLVADESVEQIKDLISPWPGKQRLDIYTETGANGFAHRPFTEHEMALFPWHTAQDILDGAVMYKDLCLVPSPLHRLLCLAYHAVYFKADGCGLASVYAEHDSGSHPFHDYERSLRKLMVEAEITPPEPLTLEALDRLMETYNWRPPMDMLERMAVWSPWVERHFFSEPLWDLPEGLTVFFVRDLAIKLGLLSDIRAAIEDHGFEILDQCELNADDQDMVTRNFRGGNWGKGPFPVDGGKPGHIVAAIDVFPRKVTGKLRKDQPLLANARIVSAKRSIRNRVLQLAGSEPFNPLHSSDNPRQALEAMKAVFPEKYLSIINEGCAAERAVQIDPAPVKILPSLSRRARVELIHYQGETAVRKVYRRNKRAFLENERDALIALAESGYVPKLLHYDETSLIIEYIQDDWADHPPMPLPLHNVHQLADFVECCARLGLDPIDLTPGKNLVCRGGRIIAIDTEFCLKRSGNLKAEELYCLRGVPTDYTGPLPLNTPSVHDPYPTQWFGYTGLKMDDFLNTNLQRQQLMRIINWPKIQVRKLVVSALHQTKLGRRISRYLRDRRSITLQSVIKN